MIRSIKLDLKLKFDPAKNAGNIAKHGISFERVHELHFDQLVVTEDKRFAYPERRYIGLGLLGDRVYSLCFSLEANVIRAISFRKAHWKEVNYYEEETQKYRPSDD